jgi:soluble lytic murein transglycosylase-like protein
LKKDKARQDVQAETKQREAQANEAQVARYEDAIHLQDALNKETQRYYDLVAETEAKIKNEPALREEAIRALITKGQKILATIEGIRARYKDVLPTLPGGSTLAPVQGISSERWNQAVPIIQMAAQEYGVDPYLALAVAVRESKLDPRARGRRKDGSYSGAGGIMQLMPDTAADMGVKDVFDETQNIIGGVKYLAKLLKDFNGDIDKVLAAYNAGPGRVKAYGGIPPLEETQKYVPASKRS